MAEVFTITDQDLQDYPNLQQKGAVVGDKVIDGKLVKQEEYAQKQEDSTAEEYILTKDDISMYPNLQEKGAEPGDIVREGKLVRTRYNDSLAQFKYQYDKSEGFTQMVGDYLESLMPLGGFAYDDVEGFGYQTADERWGKGFSDATPQERRDMIAKKRAEWLQQKWGQDFREDEDSLAGMAGTVVGSMADPSTLLPVGAGLKGVTAASGAYGGAFAAASDLSKTGTIDPVNVLVGTVAGAATGGAIKFAGDKLIQGLDKSLVRKVNKKIDDLKNQGVEVSDAVIPQIADDLKVSTDKIVRAFNRTGSDPYYGVPSKGEREVQHAMANDSAVSRVKNQWIDNALGTISTRVRNYSPDVFKRLMKFEHDVHYKTEMRLEKTQAFSRALKDMDQRVYGDVTMYLNDGNFKAAEGIMERYAPEAYEAFQPVKSVLKEVYGDLKDTGSTFDYVSDYFPRMVKDIDSMRLKLGKREQNLINVNLERYAKSNKISVHQIPAQVKEDIVENLVKGFEVRQSPTGKVSFEKSRQFVRIPEELRGEYYKPEEALEKYIRFATNTAERRRMLAGDANPPKLTVDNPEQEVNDGIANLLGQLRNSGKIDELQESNLIELLGSRFNPKAEQSPHNVIGAVRDLGYMGTIADVMSAAKQLGDLSMTGYKHGAVALAKAIIPGGNKMSLKDIGLYNTVSHEFSNPSALSKALDKMLGVSGFKAIDRLGKTTFINAALKKGQKLAKTSKGRQKLTKEWGDVYGPEMEALLADLEAGRITPLVKQHLFTELSGVQPITLSEMTKVQLDNPNARILYMLKSFMLKQYDVVRRDVVQKWRKGNKKEALRNATLLGLWLSSGNLAVDTAKNIALGREVDPNDLPTEALWSLASIYGGSKYVTDKYISTGRISEWLANQVAPAAPLVDIAGGLITEPFKEEPDYGKVYKMIPGLGTILYNYLGGGLEKWQDRTYWDD